MVSGQGEGQGQWSGSGVRVSGQGWGQGRWSGTGFDLVSVSCLPGHVHVHPLQRPPLLLGEGLQPQHLVRWRMRVRGGVKVRLRAECWGEGEAEGWRLG